MEVSVATVSAAYYRALGAYGFHHGIGRKATQAAQDSELVRIPFGALNNLMASYMHAAGPDLPLHFGSSVDGAALGLSGVIAASANNLGSFAISFSKFHPLLCTATATTIDIEREFLHLNLHCQPALELAPFAESFFASLACVARRLFGPDLRLTKVEMMHKRSTSLRSYENTFQCDVAFASNRYRITIDRQRLEIPSRIDKPETHRAMTKMALRAVALVQSSTPSLLLPAAHAIRLLEWNASLLAISRRLETSPRTLQRELSRAGTSYRQVCELSKLCTAIAELLSTSRRMISISSKLGFSEQATFSARFRAWTGLPPSVFQATFRPALLPSTEMTESRALCRST